MPAVAVTRPPWRAQDIPDAILHRDSRPSLPAEVLVQIPEAGTELPISLPYGTSFVRLAQPNSEVGQLFIWAMDIGDREPD
jgi:hypothetical protein